MNREELAKHLERAYAECFRAQPDCYSDGSDCWLAVADAALEAMRPTPTQPNDGERRKLWRDTLAATIAALFAYRRISDDGVKSLAIEAADLALTADAEKWGAK